MEAVPDARASERWRRLEPLARLRAREPLGRVCARGVEPPPVAVSGRARAAEVYGEQVAEARGVGRTVDLIARGDPEPSAPLDEADEAGGDQR